jgi:ABC-2 type transport system ATP-binding protein
LSGLTTTGLVKTYGSVRALDGIDLDVPSGAVYGLVGPNGSGKTTTLEILAGLRHPTAGLVDLGVPSGDVAYCPDAADFDPWLRAVEVLEVSIGLLGKRRPRRVLFETLERVGLARAATRRVGGFSRGMRARLGLAAGLIGDPAVLIADEPAAALDPAGRVEIIDLLGCLAGVTTVLVSSHDLAEVERICSLVGIVVDGKLAYQGELKKLLERAAPTVRIVVRPPADELVSLLRRQPWTKSVKEDSPGVLSVGVTDPAAAEAMLPTILAGIGTRLVEVRRSSTNLQGIFFELTGGGNRSKRLVER